jgi:pyruvate dehydrogenase E2 component (dihydrolipoamide acetyltransferase)
MTAAKTPILVPDLGPNITEAEIINIYVKLGDELTLDENIIALESEKTALDIPTPFAGIVTALAIKIGDKVKTGDLLLSLDTNAVRPAISLPADQDNVQIETKISHPLTALKQESIDLQDAVIDSPCSLTNLHAGPGVRRLARMCGVDLTQVLATGPKGRILLEDLQQFIKTQLANKQVNSVDNLPRLPDIDFNHFGPTQQQPLSRIKKQSARTLHRNWVQAPHVTQFEEADMTELEAFRQNQQTALQKAASSSEKVGKLTPLVFIMKALVTVLKRFPQFNASLSTDGEQLILKQYYHLGIAVDTPDGLVVPVIRDVDQKGLIALATELKTLSVQARTGKLKSSDMQGSSFTISSLGSIGSGYFTPIINLPDVAILGVSKASIKPVWQVATKTFEPRYLLPLSLSYDHRAIDGAEGAAFMRELVACLSDIRQCLL